MSCTFASFGILKNKDAMPILLKSIADIVKLCSDVLPAELYLLVLKERSDSNLLWFTFCGDDSEMKYVDGEILGEYLSRKLDNFLYIYYDERVGISMFRFLNRQEEILSIISHERKIGIVTGAIKVDYAQKDFTDEQLAILEREPKNQLTEKEYSAIHYCDDAINIGFKQLFPEEKKTYYLAGMKIRFDPKICDIWQIKENGSLIDFQEIKEVERNKDFPLWLFGGPTQKEWERSGLEMFG